MKIVFMGTPDFAVPSLELLNQHLEILAVVTATDKPGGRGNQLIQSAVKQKAMELNLPLLQPEKLKSKAFLKQLELLHADLFVVVAFRMLPEVVWNMPPMGTINLHGSLLPKYRGAAPIQRAILAGEKMTGVSCFRLTHAIDTGNILSQQSVEIGEFETGGELYDRMKRIGAELLCKTVLEIGQGKILEGVPQNDQQATDAPKIFAEDLEVDWQKSGKEIINQIRAFCPYPLAFFRRNGLIYKIHRAEFMLDSEEAEVGASKIINREQIGIRCKDGWILIHEIQEQSKRKMNSKDFINGLRVQF
ncbi:MAG TPA: methionyl-tRNA formyltransferase [Saprospiraceae bacterium]|nr:methionyl-tRNA formyltransferase [Saprospiraceae bacterium]